MLWRFLLALAIGIPAGAALSWNAVRTERSFGSVTIGSWTAWPGQGSPEADPYLRARVAAEAIVPLGVAEGIEFEANGDANRRPLERRCNYRLEGPMPQARFWTLSAMDDAGRVIGAAEGQHATAHSSSLLREPDGTAPVSLGPRPAPGNWLPVTGTGPLTLKLRLYDAASAGDLALLEPIMPRITLVSCRPLSGTAGPAGR